MDLEFEVRDTGVGLDEDVLHTIFDSFALAENVLTKQRSGLGVGLTIARSLATLMGGDISATSRPGLGSAFRFTLSCPLPVNTADMPEAQPVKACLVAATPLRVLLVEDEEVNLVMTRHMLRQMGHSVLEAANGLEALRRLTTEQVDLVLMDIQMPVMDGIETTQHIRNGEIPGLNRAIPIVALTAYARERDRKRFLELGMDEFVAKPFGMSQLAEALARTITKD